MGNNADRGELQQQLTARRMELEQYCGRAVAAGLDALAKGVAEEVASLSKASVILDSTKETLTALTSAQDAHLNKLVHETNDKVEHSLDTAIETLCHSLQSISEQIGSPQFHELAWQKRERIDRLLMEAKTSAGVGCDDYKKVVDEFCYLEEILNADEERLERAIAAMGRSIREGTGDNQAAEQALAREQQRLDVLCSIIDSWTHQRDQLFIGVEQLRFLECDTWKG